MKGNARRYAIKVLTQVFRMLLNIAQEKGVQGTRFHDYTIETNQIFYEGKKLLSLQ